MPDAARTYVGSPDASCPLVLRPTEIEVYRAPERLSAYEWACRSLRVVAGPYKGQLWKPEISPYAHGIMDTYDAEYVRKIYIIAPSQTTKTTIAYACMLAALCRKLCSVGVGMPDEKAIKRIFQEKMIPYVRSIKALRTQLHPDPRLATTNEEIAFASGERIYGMWAGSESRMSSVSMEQVVIDEEDAYQDKGAVQSQEERTTAYEHLGTSKVLRVSKPRGVEEEGSIWRDAKAEAQAWMNWEARCPSCSTYQVMDDANIKAVWGNEEPPQDRKAQAQEILRRHLARYECPHCGYQWSDEARNVAVRNGRWVPDRIVEKPTVVCFHLRSWESILVSLSKVLHDWFAAQGDPRRLRNYDNNHKAVPYKVITRETPREAVRQRIPEDHVAMTAPPAAWALTCGIDAQLTGKYFVVRAWGRDLSSWLVQRGFVRSWEGLEEVLATTYPVAGNSEDRMPIWRACIDIGGTKTEDMGVSMTEETKMWLRESEGRFPVFGVKGAAHAQSVNVRPTVVGSEPGIPRKYQMANLVIYMLDTKELKDLVRYRMSPKSQTPMWLHAESRPGELDEYVSHMTAERLVTRKNGTQYWDAAGRANHYFDCEVYAAAAADPLFAPPLHLLPESVVIRPEAPRKTSNPGSRLSGMRRSPFAR